MVVGDTFFVLPELGRNSNARQWYSGGGTKMVVTVLFSAIDSVMFLDVWFSQLPLVARPADCRDSPYDQTELYIKSWHHISAIEAATECFVNSQTKETQLQGLVAVVLLCDRTCYRRIL